MRSVAILQSNYIPWKGYFDLIASVDEFVFYEDVQYTRADWRNRNRIKTPQGVQWLTIPVGESVRRLIRDVEIADPRCGEAHWKRLVANYARSPYFSSVAAWLEPLYREAPWTGLSVVNRRLIEAICGFLGIRTRLALSSTFDLTGDRNERLVSVCKQAGATVYVSGPAAKSYLDVDAFARDGLEVVWFDYGRHAEYPQLWGPFVHEVSIVDLLFNCGPDAPRFLKEATR